MKKISGIKDTIGTTVSQGYLPPVKSLWFFAALLLGCVDKGVTPDNSPAFSAMARLGDILYVAYKPPLDVPGKSDTVTISFNYNVSKVKSIAIRATIDSQKTWIVLADLAPNSSNKAVVRWVPKDEPAVFGYFGKKECFVRVSDGLTQEHIDSDSFLICGNVPFVFVSPKSKDTFSLGDTVPIVYSQNQDRSSNLTAGFLVAGDTGFVNISDKNGTEKISVSLPIKNFITKFIPRDFAGRARNFADPITIFIADYGGAGAILKADSISIR
jgi:hypothetical protein